MLNGRDWYINAAEEVTEKKAIRVDLQKLSFSEQL